MSTTDLTTMTPAEIDTVLYDLYAKRKSAQGRADRLYRFVAGELARQVYRRGWGAAVSRRELSDYIREVTATPQPERDYTASQILRDWERFEEEETAADEAWIAQDPYHAEFDRRGGWTRAFLVTNTGGHVHSSMHCSTCRPTTGYHWVTDLSDHDEAEIVEKAGERACTVCYPSAPVEVLSRPTQIFTPDEEERARARVERWAKKEAREAAKVTLTLRVQVDWRKSQSVERQVTWKTTRALQNDTSALVRLHAGSWSMINGFDAPAEAEAREQDIKIMLAALAERGVDTDALVAKNVKRAQSGR